MPFAVSNAELRSTRRQAAPEHPDDSSTAWRLFSLYSEVTQLPCACSFCCFLALHFFFQVRTTAFRPWWITMTRPAGKPSPPRVIGSSMTSVGEAATVRDAISTVRPVGRPRHTAPSHSTKRRLVLHVCAPDEHRSARAGVRIAAASSRGVPVPDSSRVQGNRNRCIA